MNISCIKEDCVGCHACLNACPHKCISMKNNIDGFWYPFIKIKDCINCGICVKVCPVSNKAILNNNPQAFACINKDEHIRLSSSSGGIFSLIAEDILNDGGIIFGAGFDNNFDVVHSYVTKIDELEKFRGSKYVQSKIGDTYKQTKAFLKQNKRVLFIGTPCQIGGLKSYLGCEYDNLICVDFICHGVPSPKVWRKYIDFRKELSSSMPKKIAFRLKNEGWKRFSISFLFKNDIEYLSFHGNDYYMKAFLRNICLRSTCYNCKFKTLHRASDMTLADFWGIANLLPDMDDDKGTSLVLVNSIKGHAMFENIKKNIIYKAVDINQSVQYNTGAIKSVKLNPKRNIFFKELDSLSFDKLVNKYCNDGIFMAYAKKVKQLIYSNSVLKTIRLHMKRH